MPTSNDKTLLERYQREHRAYEGMNMIEHTPYRLIYVDACDAQVRWGSNDDPRGILEPGKAYAVASVDVRSSHTKVELVEFPGKRFNSVCFKQVDAERDRLSAINAELLEALIDLLGCPIHVDEATVSTSGLEETMRLNPYQVVVNMSVSLIRIRRARAAIAKAQGEQP